MKTWMWIAIVVVVLAIIIFIAYSTNKRNKEIALANQQQNEPVEQSGFANILGVISGVSGVLATSNIGSKKD